MKTEFDDALKGMHADYDEAQPDESSEYRSIGVLSITSLILGILSVLTFLWWPLALIPIAGIGFGVFAVKKILHAPDEVGGFELATLGIAVSSVFLIAGLAWQGWAYYHTVPSGYVKIDFSELAPDPKTKKISDKIMHLVEDEQRIFIEGYMYQTRRLTGLDYFNLVRTVEHCKFCSRADNPFDMIDVKMSSGLTADYRTRAVRVGGVLRFDEKYAEKGDLPYTLEADVFR